ncbi:hypothetical protein SK128_007856 [Halocaridina rubra]|uniref:Uncharacterized protein n=1 Tax=Halocaridina rubra TaxID=373956 RepID=A0AAN8WTY3_HALRR
MQKEEEDLTRYDVIRAPLPPVRNTNDKENTLSAKSDPKFNSRNEKKEEVLLESGFKYLERGNILQATLQFQKVLTINPMNTRALGAMAAIQKERKQ